MGRHLYVVDDDPEIREAIGAAAECKGYEVHLYPSGAELLEETELEGPGCILLDLRMPEIDGLALQQRLSENGTRLPIVVLSGYATVEATIRAFRQGADDFLVKPVNCEQLLLRVEQLIDRDRSRIQFEQQAEIDQQNYDSLTRRETQVLHLLIRGLSGKQIAAALGISYRTMEKFRANVMHKFDAQSVAELVHAAVRIGLDVLPEKAEESIPGGAA